MAPKLPGKFDDISKTASSVLGDDFQCKDFQLKAKQKTNLGGATSDIQVDLFGPGDGVKTPAKLSFKFPKPVAALDGFAIDKLDLDKEGKATLEMSLGQALHKVNGLKLDVKTGVLKSGTAGLSGLTYASTFTGIKDTAVKCEAKHSDPTNFTAEFLHGYGSAVIGAKFNMPVLIPAVGLNMQHGDFFGSVIAKNSFSEFTGHAHYKASNDINIAATYQHGGKASGTWAVGGAYAFSKEVIAKAKFDSGNNLSVAFKKAIAPGATLNAGATYNLKIGDYKCGAKVSIE